MHLLIKGNIMSNPKADKLMDHINAMVEVRLAEDLTEHKLFLQDLDVRLKVKTVWFCELDEIIVGREQLRIDMMQDHTYGLCNEKLCWKGKRCQKLHATPKQRTPKSKRSHCGARTRAGDTCKAKVMHGKNRCRMHGGLVPKWTDEQKTNHSTKAKRRMLGFTTPKSDIVNIVEAPQLTQCTAITIKGSRCRRPEAAPGQIWCHVHGGSKNDSQRTREPHYSSASTLVTRNRSAE